MRISDWSSDVCFPISGNIALKTGEGVAKLIYHFIKQEFTRSVFTKMAALAAMPALKALGKRMDPRNYNGASFVGVNGIVIKSHGSAAAQAFVAARSEERRVGNEGVSTCSARWA